MNAETSRTHVASMMGIAVLLWLGGASLPLEAVESPDAGASDPAEPGSDDTIRASLEQSFEAPESPRVGTPLTLRLTIEHPPRTTVRFDPVLKETRWELIESRRSRSSGENRETTVFRLTFQIFRTGRATLPPLEIDLERPDGTDDTLTTDPVDVTIASVIGDTSAPTFYDRRPPVSIPVEDYTLVWVGGSALGLALLAWAFVGWRRRRRADEATDDAPERPADVVALETLEEIEAAGHLEHGEIMTFYVRVSEVVRRYLGRRYGFPGLEWTTAEILEGLESLDWPEALDYETVEAWFRHVDMVKFSGWLPPAEKAEQTLEGARTIVETTATEAMAPEPEEPESPESEDSEPPEPEADAEAEAKAASSSEAPPSSEREASKERLEIEVSEEESSDEISPDAIPNDEGSNDETATEAPPSEETPADETPIEPTERDEVAETTEGAPAPAPSESEADDETDSSTDASESNVEMPPRAERDDDTGDSMALPSPSDLNDAEATSEYDGSPFAPDESEASGGDESETTASSLGDELRDSEPSADSDPASPDRREATSDLTGALGSREDETATDASDTSREERDETSSEEARLDASSSADGGTDRDATSDRADVLEPSDDAAASETSPSAEDDREGDSEASSGGDDETEDARDEGDSETSDADDVSRWAPSPSDLSKESSTSNDDARTSSETREETS
jgi:hypothetical protein